MPIPFKIFIAYSHNDAALLEELRKHLRPLERTGKVVIWYDGKIEPGAVWEEDIKENLHSADLILPLVSADAINSDYFYEKEVADALKRHERGEARVVPLILRPCVWRTTPLKDLQALPKNGKPVTTWDDRDSAWNDAVEALWRYVEAREQKLLAAEKQREADARLQSELEKQHLEALARQQAETQRQRQAAEAQKRQRLKVAAASKTEEEADNLHLQTIANYYFEIQSDQLASSEQLWEDEVGQVFSNAEHTIEPNSGLTFEEIFWQGAAPTLKRFGMIAGTSAILLLLVVCFSFTNNTLINFFFNHSARTYSLIYGLPILTLFGITYFAVKSHKLKILNGVITTKEGFKIGAITGLVFSITSVVLGAILFYYLSGDTLGEWLTQNLVVILMCLVTLILFSLIISLIVFLILRNNKRQ